MASTGKKLAIIGDITVDWILARSRTSGPILSEPGPLFDPRPYIQAYPVLAGPPLLGGLIRRAVGPSEASNVTFYDPYKDLSGLSPGNGAFWDVYFLVSKFPKSSSKWEGNKDWVWRLEDQIGLGRPAAAVPIPEDPQFLKDAVDSADILVVDDMRQGFWPNSPIVQRLLEHQNPEQQMLLKLTRPALSRASSAISLGKNRPDSRPETFLDFAVENFGRRLVVVVPVDELRLSGMLINLDVSWERTVEDLTRELSVLRHCKACAHFVVSIYNEGALVFSNDDNGQRITLFYDPRSMERNWPQKLLGTMRGYTQCLTAGIALHMMRSSKAEDISPGILGGLEAARMLHQVGLAPGPIRGDSTFPQTLDFPTEKLSEALSRFVVKGGESHSFQRQRLVAKELENVDDNNDVKSWSLLVKKYPPAKTKELLRQARRIVEWGVEDQEWTIPIVRFGELVVVDRGEIDNLLAIRSLISGYISSIARTTPLSIAVFGHPGTGKSFTIKEISKSLNDGKSRDLTFNLSQFTDPEQIYYALHQVRDEALTGVPLVFWDEFDSKYGETDFGWLRYFLAPMQDGTFQEKVVTHNIGRSVFVFAGGTTKTMRQFRGSVEPRTDIKGPDFLSRLQGHVDVPGLTHVDPVHAGTVIRRAFLLRSFITSFAKHLAYFVEPTVRAPDGLKERINVDLGVINAFMHVPTFRYGARSMEAIVKMSSLKDRDMYDRSSLPTENQLEMHVDAKEFLALVERHEPWMDAKA